MKISIGADIGGTHITCAAVNMEEGTLLPNTLFRASYDHEAAADVVLHSWANALNHTLLRLDESPPDGIGFAMPGPFDYQNGVSKMHHKFPRLYDLCIATTLRPSLATDQKLPMRFLNDATCFAIGEAWQGQGKAFRKVVVITLGTGFGSAFLNRGIPVVSGALVPKEGCLWHLPFHEGIADDYFSTRWFIEEYENKTREKISGVKELMEKAETEPSIAGLFNQFGKNLAECLSPWLQLFGAEILIVGGNIAHALPLFTGSFQENIQQSGLAIPIVASQLMENAALLGSARLLDDSFWHKVSVDLPRL